MKSDLRKQFIKGNKLNFILAVLVSLILVGMNICLAFMLRMFIEAIEQGDSAKLRLGVELTIGYLVLFLLFSLLKKKYTALYFKTALSQFKNYVFEKLLSKSIAEFENGTSSKFLSAFSNDLHTIETGYLGGILDIIYTVIMFAAAGAVLIVANPLYGIPIVVLGVVAVFISVRFGAKLINREKETAEENMGFIAQTKELLNGFFVIKSFRAEKDVLALFKNRNSSLESTKQRRRETATSITIFSDIISILINVIVYGFGFLLALKGYMTIGIVISSIQLGSYIIQPIYNLGPDISTYRAALSLIDRLEDAIAADPASAKDAAYRAEPLRTAIEISDLTFSYDDTPVLRDVSLRFESGKSYAIVGSSGSGKSTLLKLLLGYRSSYDGSILYDDTDIKDIDLDSLYDRLSIIQQEVFLFDSTIEDNITMFKDFEREKLKLAIDRAGLSALVKEKGLDYGCGEAGDNLSGGEKQRVSIARCLLRESSVLLADEPTASLDNETAAQIENAVLNIDGCTKIIVTHRFNEAILMKYDEIIALNHGTVAERGSFHDLMAKRGYFYSLFTVSQGE